ncbi:hypothetical protein Tco_0745216 [Tanacetum coccineum]
MSMRKSSCKVIYGRSAVVGKPTVESPKKLPLSRLEMRCRRCSCGVLAIPEASSLSSAESALHMRPPAPSSQVAIVKSFGKNIPLKVTKATVNAVNKVEETL